jgi:hypothetical protein
LLRETLQVIMRVKLGDGSALGGPRGDGATAGVAAEEEIIA